MTPAQWRVFLIRSFVEGYADDHLGLFFQYHIEEAVIGTQIILVLVEGEQQLVRFFFEKVYRVLYDS